MKDTASFRILSRSNDDSDSSTTFTETVSDTFDFHKCQANDDDRASTSGSRSDISFEVPVPGHVNIIKDVTTKRVIALHEGKIILTEPDWRDSFYWACTEVKGWLGFKNTVSGRYLGHNLQGWIVCSANEQKGWEFFLPRVMPNRSYLLSMTHYDELRHLNSKIDKGTVRLTKLEDDETEQKQWQFLKMDI